MPLKKEQFVITEDNLVDALDVDDGVGRSVPVNMNIIDVGYLSKDTGCSLFGAVETTEVHSPFHYKKKDGTSYFIRAKGTKLQKYNSTTALWEDLSPTFTAGAKFGYVVYNDILYGGNGVEATFSWDGTTFTDITSAPKGNVLEIFEDRLFITGVTNGTGVVGTCTMTIASPAVVTKTTHRLSAGDKITFITDGALPTGVTANTTYYVISTGLTANTFQFSTTLGGSAVNTSGTQSGTHTLFVLEKPQPLSIYYSNVGVPTTFDTADILQPVGTDSVVALKNYYGALLIFKTETIWKLTFVYDSITNLYLPKLELQSGTYGACGRNAVIWVENDLWFFTGREVRSIGFKDQQQGVLGINSSIISNQIKEVLKNISSANFTKVALAYNNRRFYLSVPLDHDYNDTIFVCHLLYKNAWTKYANRIKAQASEMIVVDDILYSTKSITSYGMLKWDNTLLNDNGSAISAEVYLKKVEDKDFNVFNTYRYLDLIFKDLSGKIIVTIKQDANDLRTQKTTQFYIGNGVEDELGSVGETDIGEMLIADSFGQDIDSSPFIKKRLSFLSKAQSLTIGLSNNVVDNEFTLVGYSLMGMRQPRKQFKPSGIISV